MHNYVGSRLRSLLADSAHRFGNWLTHTPGSNICLRNAFDQLPIGTAILDKQGRIAYTNPTFHHIFGHTPQDVRTQSIDELIAGTRVAEATKLTKLAGEGRVERESIRYAKDGSVRHVIIKATPYKEGLLVFYADRTAAAREESFTQRGHVAAAVVHRLSNKLCTLQLNIGFVHNQSEDESEREESYSEIQKTIDYLANMCVLLRDCTGSTQTHRKRISFKEAVNSPMIALLTGQGDQMVYTDPRLSRRLFEYLQSKKVKSFGAIPHEGRLRCDLTYAMPLGDRPFNLTSEGHETTIDRFYFPAAFGLARRLKIDIESNSNKISLYLPLDRETEHS